MLPFGPEGLAVLKKRWPNPCVYVYGADPQGRRCGDGCRHLWRKNWGRYSYYKCALRGDSNGEGTDHRKKWPACAKYEEDS